MERQAEFEQKGGKADPSSGRQRDFLDDFVRIHAENAESLPFWSTLMWTFGNIIAGGDSTAVVMRTCIYHLLAYPDQLSRLRQELLSVEGLCLPFPSWKNIGALPYLDAVVSEAVRFHPPFALPFERVVPEGGATILGKFLPGGTFVGINAYVVNRHKATFGEDADEWRPERWIECAEEQRRKMEASIFTVSYPCPRLKEGRRLIDRNDAVGSRTSRVPWQAGGNPGDQEVCFGFGAEL